MRHKALLAGILDGVALPGSIYEKHMFRRSTGSDLDRMRGDVERVGSLFAAVIGREHDRAQAAPAQRAPKGAATKK